MRILALVWRNLVHLGGVLGHLGPSWGHLGAVLGRLGAILGRLGAILGRLGREDGYDRRSMIEDTCSRAKMYKNLRKTIGF